MKHLFALLLILLHNVIVAQLSIRNDEYVFVDNDILFVNDDVNLNESDSHLYLRNEAQLIQGSGITGNSGVGTLSIYQEGNVGAYEYNYWCSPVGDITSSSTNNPFGITLLNDVVSLTASTPAVVTHVTGYNSTSSPLTIEPYWIWKYITSDTYADWIHVRDNTSINAGEGFTMKGTIGSGDAQRYDFRGKPNNGTILVNVENNQFTLVGNPYPSAIDAVSYIHDSDNASVISGTLYFWEQDPTVNSHYLRDYDGGYATYTIDATGTIETYVPAVFSTYNGDGTINGVGAGSPSGKRPHRYIPVGQGFMVEGITSGFVRAKNSHRVYVVESSSNSSFFKNVKKEDKSKINNSFFSKVSEGFKRFRLNIDFNNAYTRQLVETFHSSATNMFDYGLESKINEKGILKSDAYLNNNDEYYIAEALNFETTLNIPLTIKVAHSMPVQIRITDIQNFDDNLPIYLHDIENETYTNLRTQDYMVDLDKGAYKNRFEITFEKNSLTLFDNEVDNFKVIQNDKVGELQLINPDKIKISSFYLYDASGKEVISDHKVSLKSINIYNSKKIPSGIYFTNVDFYNGKQFFSKVLINN